MSPGTPCQSPWHVHVQQPQARVASGIGGWAPQSHLWASRPEDKGCDDSSVWHLKRYTDGNADHFEEFLLTLSFAEKPDGSNCSGGTADGVNISGCLAPCAGSNDAVIKNGSVVKLDGQLTKVSLRLEHQDPHGGELCVYRSERFVTEGDGQFRGVWMCGAKTGRFSAARRSLPDETRKQRKSACRRKADAEIRSKRFFNDLKDDLLILDRLGWSEQKWKGESKLEKGRAILLELQRELGKVFQERGIWFLSNTPWLQRVETGISLARQARDAELLRQLRAVDCSFSARPDDKRSDWHTLLEIQRSFCALPPFRATRYLEPSGVRHALRCAEVVNRAAFGQGGLFLGGARQILAGLPEGPGGERAYAELRPCCIAGDLGVDEAFDVRVQLIVRAGCSEFVWEPGPDVKVHYNDRVYYEQAHVWCEERRVRRYRHGQDAVGMQQRLVEFERFLTGGGEGHVYEEDFEFVEMTSRAESGAAEGVPAFLEHSVTGDVKEACDLFEHVGTRHGWTCRPKALNLGQLFKTRLAGYRRVKTREIVWGPGPGLYWERGDRPLRLLRMSQEPVRVHFNRSEEPYGFHLQDSRGGAGGAEVIEVVEGSPADVRGVVVGRTVKRLCSGGRTEDVRHWTKAQIETALRTMDNSFVVEFGKGDTEERRHAPLGDAEMAILMDERFMRGFLHELWHGHDDGAANRLFDHDGWAQAFPGLKAAPSSAGHAVEEPQGRLMLATGANAPTLMARQWPGERSPSGQEPTSEAAKMVPPQAYLPLQTSYAGFGRQSRNDGPSARVAATGKSCLLPGTSVGNMLQRTAPLQRSTPSSSSDSPAAGGQSHRGDSPASTAPGTTKEDYGEEQDGPSPTEWRERRSDYPLKVQISLEDSSLRSTELPLFHALKSTGPTVTGDVASLHGLQRAQGLDLSTAGQGCNLRGSADPPWLAGAQLQPPVFARAPPGLPPPTL